jgi:predicted TIM-barrel fold metal-dependent hydrolase
LFSYRSHCLIVGCALFSSAIALAQRAPAAEHHAHLQSPIAARLLTETGSGKHEQQQTRTAQDLIAAMDAAKVAQSVALSDAYRFASPRLHIADEAKEVDRENEWTVAQAAQYPGRLVAFCSVGPLKPYAEAAINHCHALGMRGLKIHLANSGFHFDRPEDVRALAAVFKQANRFRMAILIHIRNGEKWDYSTAMQLFTSEVLPQAPDVVVQIAHLSGWGGYDRATDAGLSALLDLCDHSPKVCSHLYFDLAAVVLPANAATAEPGGDLRFLADEQKDFPEAPKQMAAKLRRIGLHRVLFATDWPIYTQAEFVSLLRTQLLLNPSELNQILGNKAPYFEQTPSRHSPGNP